MPTKRFPPTDPREWLRRAMLNLARSQNLLEDADYEDYCFDAQQTAEKAIKTVFIQNGLTAKRIHDLRQLLTILAGAGVRCAQVPHGRRSPDTLCGGNSLSRILAAGQEAGIPACSPNCDGAFSSGRNVR